VITRQVSSEHERHKGSNPSLSQVLLHDVIARYVNDAHARAEGGLAGRPGRPDVGGRKRHQVGRRAICCFLRGTWPDGRWLFAGKRLHPALRGKLAYNPFLKRQADPLLVVDDDGDGDDDVIEARSRSLSGAGSFVPRRSVLPAWILMPFMFPILRRNGR